MTTIANSIWVATALLHREHPNSLDFTVGEIVGKTIGEKLVDGYRPALQVFASKHCVANKSPNPITSRMLFETVRGRRRLFRTGDPFDAGRKKGKIRPEKADVPPAFHSLIDWYDADYSTRASRPQANALVAENPEKITLESQPRIAFIGPAGSVVIPDAMRKDLGIEEGARLIIRRDQDRIILQPVTEELISKLRGSCKGGESLVEAREREHQDENY